MVRRGSTVRVRQRASIAACVSVSTTKVAVAGTVEELVTAAHSVRRPRSPRAEGQSPERAPSIPSAEQPRGRSAPPTRRHDEQAEVPDLDLAGRFRRRPEPEHGEPARRGRRAAPRLGRRAGRLAPSPRHARRRGEREHADSRGIGREHRCRRDGPEHVRSARRWPLGRRAVDGLVGRRPALPPPRLRPHPSPARSRRDGGRDHVPLRHRRHRVRARTGEEGRRRQGRHALGRRQRRSAVPGGGTAGRARAPRRSRVARRRCAPLRRPRGRGRAARAGRGPSRRPASRTSSTAS